MRAVVQRVSRADVQVDGAVVGRVAAGLLVYAVAAPDDAADDVAYTADKIANLRVFVDEAGKLNRSLLDLCAAAADLADPSAAPGVLLISAFTVLADARKGRRPSLDGAAPGAIAEPLIEQLAAALRTAGLRVETGRFAAHMLVSSVNDGPICILLDSRRVI